MRHFCRWTDAGPFPKFKCMNSNENDTPPLSDDHDHEDSSPSNSPERTPPEAEKRVPFLQRTSPLESKLLTILRDPNYRAVKAKVISDKLGLSDDQVHELKQAVKRLSKKGIITFGDKHRILPLPPAKNEPIANDEPRTKSAPAPKIDIDDDDATAIEPDVFETRPPHKPKTHVVQERPRGSEKRSRQAHEIIGSFRRTQSGSGYVRPKSTGSSKPDRSLDILIPKNVTQDASNGDTVRVRILPREVQGRVAGEVLEIVERATSRFVGTFDDRLGDYTVQIDGRVIRQPVPVGDPGAKAVVAGDKVVIEMVRFPTPWDPGEGVIVEVLGKKGTPGIDTLSIIREFNLPDDFPEEALESAREQALAFDEAIGSRRDLTQETIITIDPFDARDFDDAISLHHLENGHWRLGVHIADVSHFVPLKSPLDWEARERATSIYLPDRVIPMLPEIISNHLASLQPDKLRYAKTVFIEFNPEGVPVHSEYTSSAIKSVRRFTYEEVDEYLADPREWVSKLTPAVHDLVGRMHELAMILRKRRLERGAMELTLPEVKIDLDKTGEVSGAHLVVNTVSHQIIEEFMLAANEAVARILSEANVHFLRRVHEAPDPRKLKSLTTFVRELGIPCESLESRFEIKRVIAAVQGEPNQQAVNYAVLRSMQKAIYSPVDEGHYALNSEDYCHFTSPIRRYPDLTVHRQLDALAAGKRPKDDLNSMSLLADHCSEREVRAQRAERELVKLKLLNYLSTRIGMQLEAVVTGVEQFGLFAMGIELPAEGLIHIDSLQDDYYRFDADTHTLEGHRAGKRYRLGDRLIVEVANVDIDGRELDFRLIKRISTAEPSKLKKKFSSQDRDFKAGRGKFKSKHKGSDGSGKKKKKRR